MNDNSSTVIIDDDQNNEGAKGPVYENYNKSDMGMLAKGSMAGQRNNIDSSLSNDFSPAKRSQTA